jgi:hypothetical protein
MCREALTALDPRVYDTLLEIAITAPEKRALNQKVWAALEVLYYLMIRPLLDPDNEEERKEKSGEVQDQAVEYVDAFAAAVGREFCCYDCAWLSLTALSTVTCNLWL